MQVGSINSSYNNYNNYQNSKMNFKGDFQKVTRTQLGNHIRAAVDKSISGSKAVMDKRTKQTKFNQLYNTAVKNIRFIQNNQSPLVEGGLKPLKLVYYGNPQVVYDPSKLKVDMKYCHIDCANALGNLYSQSESVFDLFEECFTSDENRIARELDFIGKAKSTLDMLQDSNAYIKAESDENNSIPYNENKHVFDDCLRELKIPEISNYEEFNTLLETAKVYQYDLSNPKLHSYKEFLDIFVKPLTKNANKFADVSKYELAMTVYNKLQEASMWFQKHTEFCTEEIAKNLGSVIKAYEASGLLEKYYDYKSRNVDVDMSILDDPKNSDLFIPELK